MKYVGFKSLLYVLLLLSVVATGLGGWLDVTGRTAICGVTKEHLWHDGQYLLLVAIFLILVVYITK